ncbi:MAG: GNAT family N-acetyltransferase [Candidatus Thermoplasmatota archaeon]|nr:GNAT family N-acetyltransferase [Candidatus Thermoplasmatota archaeon]
MEIRDDYTIGDLNASSWPAFEEFFNKYNGVQNSCWCVYYHKGVQPLRVPKKDKAEHNRNLKRRLVEGGKSRSVLVFKSGKVVASCQYGTFEELPRIENAARYASVKLKEGNENRWRITCFFVDTPERHKGLAKLALDGALDRIARNGGGLVEAYPVTKRNTVEVWFGSVGMFVERGFKIVSEFGKSNVLVRKMIEPIEHR